MDDPLEQIMDTLPPSQLMQLPSELRLRIYGYVWPKGTTRIKILFNINGTIVRDGFTRQDGCDETALLKTCRKVYREGLSVMYDSITFALHSVCRDFEPINGDKVLDFLFPWLEHAQHLELGFWALGIPSSNMGLFYLLGNLNWRFESEKLKRVELVKVGIYGCELRYGTREFGVDLGWVMGTLVGLRLCGKTVVQTLAKVPPCHFMKLPPELRLEIYGYVWSEKKRIKILFDFNGKVVRDGSLGSIIVTRLQSTYRLIHHEALPVLYGSITFDLRSVDRIIEPLDCDKLLALKTPWLKYIQFEAGGALPSF
ncbi:hypothetical protein LTR10_000673 [Elasticomyces elasticus]|nr:hypothetical protein LTR10_000673 [Elasticomyces elasticus]KAK4980078.1 hypothetical protein LTR42_000385 [Elasticomyces elasticus]